MSARPCPTIHSAAAVRTGRFGILHLLSIFARSRAIRAQRRHLSRLDDALLRDIGLTRDQARAEAARPVWDVPAYWHR